MSQCYNVIRCIYLVYIFLILETLYRFVQKQFPLQCTFMFKLNTYQVASSDTPVFLPLVRIATTDPYRNMHTIKDLIPLFISLK